MPFIETSAKEIINTNELFDLTIRTYVNKMNNNTGRRTENGRSNTLIIDVNKDDKKDFSCCPK